LLISLASGCYATTSTGYVGGGAVVTTTTVEPDLVYVSPGVQVIADYDEPIFYSDGFYWRETGGIWYRSRVHTGGWVTYSAPHALITVRDRHTYRHYRPAGYVPRHQVRDNRDYRARETHPVQHDNRRYEPPRREAPPVTRDNRRHDAPVTRDNRKRHDDDDDKRTRDHRH
jgi:hypothetical protein